MSLIRNLATALVGNEARKRGRGGGILGMGLGILATRIATRSIPGALLVGGALVAKTLYDRSREEENDVAAADQVIDIEGQPVPDEKSAT